MPPSIHEQEASTPKDDISKVAETEVAVTEATPLLPTPPSDIETGIMSKDAPPKEPWTATHVVLWSAALALFIYVVYTISTTSPSTEFDLGKALKSALGGGLAGAAAMVLQVLTLMPIRTVMNYQYRYGTSLSAASSTLYAEGGFRRFYAGLLAALFQGPISRFGDTAANAGILAFLEGTNWPSGVKTVGASAAAALFRMTLTPVDTIKTTMQAEGSKKGWGVLKRRVRAYGIGTMWYGAWATAAATFVGHYPWFATYNYLSANFPVPDPAQPHGFFLKLLRAAFIGFVASVISDTVSNSLRVVKTYRQVNETKVSYTAAAQAVIRADGLSGLFGRGLKTRIVANGLQGLMFSVLWRLFLDLWNDKTK